MVLDGRNRLDALALLGRPLDDGDNPTLFSFESVPADAAARVLSLNGHRLHLSSAQKREAIAALLKMSTEKSDRAIAQVIKVADTTVAKVRKTLEAKGTIAPQETVAGKPGVVQPRKKAVKAKTVEPVATERTTEPAIAVVEPVDPSTALIVIAPTALMNLDADETFQPWQSLDLIVEDLGQRIMSALRDTDWVTASAEAKFYAKNITKRWNRAQRQVLDELKYLGENALRLQGAVGQIGPELERAMDARNAVERKAWKNARNKAKKEKREANKVMFADIAARQVVRDEKIDGVLTAHPDWSVEEVERATKAAPGFNNTRRRKLASEATS